MNQELLKLLKLKTNYSWEELKRKMEIESNEELIAMLFVIVRDGLENFNINSSPINKHYIEKALHYLNYRGINKMIDQHAYYVDELNDLIMIGHRLLSTIYSENKLYLHNKEQLERILLALKQVKHKFYHTTYRKQDMKDEQDQLFQFLSAMIKNVEDYQLYEELFLEDKDLINIVNSQGFCLLDGVIDQYVQCVKSSHNIQKIHYYQSMIELLMHHSSNRISQELCFSLIDELNQLTLKIGSSDLSYEEKKYRLTHIYDMMNILSNAQVEQNTSIQLDNAVKKYGISLDNDAIYEALCMNLEPRQDVSLQDHTNKKVYTLDRKFTTIYDDAVCIEKNNNQTIIYYYFPLVADYIGPKSPINKYLESMSSSIYAYQYIKRMLPFDFVKQNCSFNEGQVKRAFTIEVRLNLQNEIQQIKCYRSNVKISKNYYYEFSKQLDIIPELREMVEYAEVLNTKLENLNIHSMINVVEFYSDFCQKAIQILAKQNNIPLIYKENSKEYRLECLRQLQQAMNLEDNGYVSNVIRVISEQNYSCKVYTLQEKKHIPFTNPTREYASLLNQRILLQELVDYDIQCYYKDLEETIQKLNEREIKNNRFTTEYSKLKIRSLKEKRKKPDEDKVKALTKVMKMIQY